MKHRFRTGPGPKNPESGRSEDPIVEHASLDSREDPVPEPPSPASSSSSRSSSATQSPASSAPAPSENLKAKGGKKKRSRIRQLLPLLMIAASVLIMLYPVVASQWNNIRQQEFANQYNKNVASEPAASLEQAYQEALAYNQELQAGKLRDPWNESTEQNTENYQHYLSLLSIQNPMAVLRIPSIELTLPVYHGTSADTLNHGLGHLYGTALPVGGKGSRAAITGHTGLATATLFDRLTEVKTGEFFYVDVLGKTLKYQVKLIEVVLPDELDRLQPNPDEDLVTLVTCTPYGVNSHRLLVTGQRVETVDETDLPPNPPKIKFIWRPWMTYMVLAIIVGIGSGIFFGGALGKKRRRKDDAAGSAPGDSTPGGSVPGGSAQGD